LLAEGQSAKAKEVLQELVELNLTLELDWVEGVIARAQAQLSTDTIAAGRLFSAAIEAFQRFGMQFEVARTLLARGRKLNEAHGDGSQDLLDAQELFRGLGATLWRVRCVSEAAPNVQFLGETRASASLQTF
jgi:hypothetical protein